MAKNKKLDFVVIGDSLSAILTAVQNAQNGHVGAIISGAESLGGLHRGLVLNKEYMSTDATPCLIDTHMNYIPNTEKTVALLEQIQRIIPNLNWNTQDIGPITFHNGTTQPFLGFGAHTVDAIDFYSYFTSPQQIKTNLNLAEITIELMKQFSGDIFTNSEVTKIDIQENFSTIECNGTDLYTTDRIYYFESPAKLAKVVPTNSSAFAKTSLQKLAKSQQWAAINLVYWHKSPSLTETEAVHILYGAKDLPCLGTFSTTTNTLPVSQWMSILSAESFAETEQLGLAIREMKKQIKRMYPSFFDSVEKEFIVISPEAFGNAPVSVTNNPDLFKNGTLFLGSQHYSSEMALVGEASSHLALTSFFKQKVEKDQVDTQS